MKKFTYVGGHSLHYAAADWLANIGLRETRWILDADCSYDITYKQWMRMGR